MIYAIPGITLNTATFSLCGNVMVILIKLCIIWMETKLLKHKRIVMFRRKVILIQTLMTLLASIAYMAYEKTNVQSHLGMLDLTYFFVVTMTTIGFGDVTNKQKNFLGNEFFWTMILEFFLFLLVFAMVASLITAIIDAFTQGKDEEKSKDANEVTENEFAVKNISRGDINTVT